MKTLPILFLICTTGAAAPPKSIDPEIQKMVAAVSGERIAAIEKKLETFGTRNVNTFDETGERGIGAAGRWIYDQFRSYSPKLEVRFDKHRVKKQGRVVRDIELTNIVAVLPGTQNRERQFVISGHYDSIVMPKGGEDRPATDDAVKLEMTKYSQPAPGVTDDASGTAAVMEMARVMSGHEFRNTVVFIAFAGEEVGLYGSALYAQDARRENQIIDGVLNNDIIGSEVAGNGFIDNGRVRVFSEDPNDSPSRQIARYLREVSERYVPSMKVEMVFRADRFGRGGDHTSFNQQQYPAVRITTPDENYANQHTITDTSENTSIPYVTRVTKVNAAALASLAMAPKAPVVDRVIEQGERKGQATPMVTRGKSGYDAVLRWKNEKPEADVAGYVVVERSTTAPDWEREIYVGLVDTFTLENVSIDDRVFGVKTVDREGHESLVSAYTFKPRALRKIETW